MRALGRLVLVPLGFCLAALVAGFVLVTLGLERFTQATHGRDIDVRQASEMVGVALALLQAASIATLVPALLVVIIGEVARIRALTYYVAGGGIALASLPFLATTGSLGKDLSMLGGIWQVFATAGFAAGLAYWLIAGRRA